MSPLLLYAITTTGADAADAAGSSANADANRLRAIADACGLLAVSEGGLAALAGERERSPAADETPAALWAYERAVEAAMAVGSVLPVRYGTLLADAGEVRALLRDRAGELRAALRRVSGAVEVSVRAAWVENAGPADGAPVTGTSYLLGRLERQRRAQRLAARLDGLAPLARAARIRLLPHAGVPAAGAFLLDRAGVEPFADRVRQLDAEIEDAALVCTGPWPPYSFAEGAAA